MQEELKLLFTNLNNSLVRYSSIQKINNNLSFANLCATRLITPFTMKNGTVK